MHEQDKDPFYVGYLPLPPAIRSFILPWLVGNLVLAVGIAAVVAQQHRPPGDGTWQTWEGISVEGQFFMNPYPVLRTDDATYILVGQGKVGIQDDVRAMKLSDGDLVVVTGSPIEREGRSVLEVYEPAVDIVRSNANAGPSYFTSFTRIDPLVREDLGTHTLRGEIVDPKCYLGVMQPGDGKTHKACATLCIKGGIPPMFLVRDTQGRAAAYLLTDAEGGAIPESVHPYIADPIELTGQVLRDGDLLVLQADLGSIKRLD